MQNESGSPQAIVATTSHSSPDNRCFGLVVSPKSKAQTLADLKGKDIAVSSATIIDFLLAQLLQQEGAAPYFLNRQDIRQIPVRLQMLLSGQIESALREAAKRINETPDAYRPIMEAKGLLPKGASANYTMVRFDMTHTPTGLPSEADIKTFADWMKANRILKKDPAYGDVVFQ